MLYIHERHNTRCVVVQKIAPLNVHNIVKCNPYTDSLHQDESNELVTCKKQHNSSYAVLPLTASVVKHDRFFE